ncbi:MAG: hypothetical protein AAFZ07_11820 [Actinomycetota bacterium]
MTEPILVLGPPDDAQVLAVERAAAARGVPAEVLRLSTTRTDRWTWTTDRIETSEGDRLDRVRGIYVRSMPTPAPDHRTEHVHPSDEAAWLERAERRRRQLGFFKSAQLALDERGVPILNSLWGYRHHRSKPGADAELAAAGLPVPRGVATSDPASVEDLLDEVGDVVYKPVAGGGRCRVLDPSMLRTARARLEVAPVYFQELVPGRNLRIYAIDDRVVAAFDIEADDVDFRGAETAITVIEVDDEVAGLAVEAAKVLGLRFSGSDIKRTPDGRLVVLDVNPSPMFAGIDHRVGGAIAGSIVDTLAVAR